MGASSLAYGSLSTPSQGEISPAGERPPKSQARSAGVISCSEWWSRAAAQPLELINYKGNP